MAEMYRVIVTRDDYDAEEGCEVSKVVFELAGPQATVARFAPLGVAEALGTVANIETDETPRVERAGSAETMTQDAVGGQTKRRRRTKAEMEADRARESAAGPVDGTGSAASSVPDAAEPIQAEAAPVPPAAPPVYNPFAG